MNTDQMAIMFTETKISAVEETLKKFGINEPISQKAREKAKEEIKRFLEMEVLDYD